MKPRFFLLAAMAVIATGCVKDELPEAPIADPEDRETVILSATEPEYVGEDGTRTELDGMSVKWNKGDEIALVDINNNIYFCENIAEDGEPAQFTTDLTLDEDNKLVGNFGNSHILVFPASGVYEREGSTGMKGVEVPDTQPLIADNIGDDCNIAFAQLNSGGGYNGDNLKFYNACGLLRLRLRSEDGVKLKYVQITAPLGSSLVGFGFLDLGTGSFYHDGNRKFTGTRTVTLEYNEDEEPVALTSEATNFYACVVPTEAYRTSGGNLTSTINPTNTGAKAGAYKVTFVNEKDEIKTTTLTLEKDILAGRITTLGQVNISKSGWKEINNETVDKDEALAYVFDESTVAEIHVRLTTEEWNNFLTLYDKNAAFDDYVYCDATFKTTKGGEVKTHEFIDAGLRMRGATSRRRPEGTTGEMHNSANPDWHHCHFMLNLRKFMKDDSHKIGDVRKIHLKWFHNDPTYVCEPFNYHIFRKFGIWTSLKSSYCRLWIQIDDEPEAYFGVYTMMEAIDERYLKAKERKGKFGSDKFNLWKCGKYADLITTEDWRFKNDPYAGVADIPYVLKTNTDNYRTAKAQLLNFITNINTLEGEDYRTWAEAHMDVELLLRTYAVSVACGKWDDYWCGANNYYMYFNSNDVEDYQFFFIPYDHDNTLGSYTNINSATHNPLKWYRDGDENAANRKLISKLLEFDDYRKIYLDALTELCNSDELMSEAGARALITGWWDMIGDVANDTGEDMVKGDRTGGYDFRVTDDNDLNFFRLKKKAVERAIKEGDSWWQ